MKQKGLAPILIVLLVAILGIGGVFAYRNYSNNKTTITVLPAPSTDSNLAPITPRETTSSADNDNPNSIENLITYKLPSGWIKKEYAHSLPNLIYLQAPPWAAIEIERYANKNPQSEIDKVLHPKYPNESQYSDIKLMKIGGYNAVSFHYDFEGHFYSINVAQENFNWLITVSTDLSSENQHRSEIDSFINSIKLK
jgi:hypothetical protein